jgi:hypothetical protein
MFFMFLTYCRPLSRPSSPTIPFFLFFFTIGFPFSSNLGGFFFPSSSLLSYSLLDSDFCPITRLYARISFCLLSWSTAIYSFGTLDFEVGGSYCCDVCFPPLTNYQLLLKYYFHSGVLIDDRVCRCQQLLLLEVLRGVQDMDGITVFIERGERVVQLRILC